MKQRKKWYLGISIAVFILLLYLLFPLSSRKFAIANDEEKEKSKLRYLEECKKHSAVLSKKPNVILITADDLGKTDISLYGSPYVSTPNIDSIGNEGVIFSEAYCSSPICSPSRAGFLTGRYQQRFGFEFQPRDLYPRNRLEKIIYKYIIDTGEMYITKAKRYPRKKDIAQQGIPGSEITLGEILSGTGYRTASIGKWHLGYADPFVPNARGFEYQYGFYEAFSLYAPVDDPDIVNYRHDYFANKHIWNQERKGPCAVRRNNEVIEEEEYLTFRIAEEVNDRIDEWEDEPFFIHASFSAPHTPFQVPKEYYNRFSHVKDKNKRVYYGMIAALDDAVGSILSVIEKRGLEENTIIFFASDNGGATYTGATDNFPLKGGKFTNFEGGINIPFMVRWPGTLKPGTLFDEPVILLDVFTTSIAAAGLPLTEERILDGVDLLPFITGEAAGSPHDALFWRSGFNKAVRKGDWKLILDTRENESILYNVRDDKLEKRDVSAQNPEKKEELLMELESWEKELMDPLWPHLMDHKFVIDGEEYFFAL